MSAAPIRPHAPGERALSIDVLRGLALLGILLVNIESFARVSWVMRNPAALGELAGAELWFWGAMHLLADRKVLELFSLLFGAGMLLFAQRAAAAGWAGFGAHLRRSGALLLLGSAHGYLLWHDDILFTYGVCALALYPLHRIGPRALLGVGLLFLAVPSVLLLATQLLLPEPSPRMAQMIALQWTPSDAMMAREIDALRGGWWQQMNFRVPLAWNVQFEVLLTFAFWRAGGMMLLGMALQKWRVLEGARSPAFYAWLAGLGLIAGFALDSYGAAESVARGFAHAFSAYAGWQIAYWAGLLVVLGYVGLVVPLASRPRLQAVFRPLADVGRMSLTNYLLQTLICTTLFYGHGMALFMSFDAVGRLALVLGIWAFEIGLSVWWLRRFRFGPLEWLWRGVTYWQMPPLRVGVARDRPGGRASGG
jgi:uncharacterized protein